MSEPQAEPEPTKKTSVSQPEAAKPEPAKKTSVSQPEAAKPEPAKKTSVSQPEAAKPEPARKTSVSQPEAAKPEPAKRTSITQPAQPEPAKRTSITHPEPGKKQSATHPDGRKHSRGSADIRDLSRLNVRKGSYGFGGVSGIRPLERTSQTGIEFKRPFVTFLNTYQLDPLKKFHLANVLKVIEQILDEAWHDHKYHESESPSLAIKLAGECMKKVKAMGFNRYRIISIVTIGQKRKQSYNNSISMLWDYERDGYVDTHRETTTAFVQVTVFGIYLD